MIIHCLFFYDLIKLTIEPFTILQPQRTTAEPTDDLFYHRHMMEMIYFHSTLEPEPPVAEQYDPKDEVPPLPAL